MSSSGVAKIFGFLVFFLGIELLYIYLNMPSSSDIAIKKEFVKLSTLSDLAISNEASFIRHRSLSDYFSIYSEDPSLGDYFVSTFIYKEGAK